MSSFIHHDYDASRIDNALRKEKSSVNYLKENANMRRRESMEIKCEEREGGVRKGGAKF